MFIIAIVIIVIAVLFGGMHKIEEGHVGIYYTFGILQKTLAGPGYNFRVPVITNYESVQISVQTDQVVDIPCGTSGGVMLYFDKIEVVNKLQTEFVYETIKNYTGDYDKIWIYDKSYLFQLFVIFSKVHHEINQFCSKHTLNEVFIDLFDTLDEELISALQGYLKVWAPGIQIISIRVTKPRIPIELKKKFEEIEKQRSQLLITEEQQKIQIQNANAEQKQSIFKMQSELDVTQMTIDRQIQEKISELNISKIDIQIYLEKEKGIADTQYYNTLKQIETNKSMLTQQYLFDNAIESLFTNVNFAVGEQIPSYINPQQLK